MYLTAFKKMCIFITVALGLLISTITNGAPICQSGTNWIANCAAGTDTFSISMTFGIDTELVTPRVADFEATFVGEMTVARSSPYSSTTSPSTDYLDRINTEILSLSVTGITPEVAGWHLYAGTDYGLRPSTGFIQEEFDTITGQPLDTAHVNFDLAFEIANTPYGILTTTFREGFMFFDTVIDEWPGTGALSHNGCCFGGTLYEMQDSNGDPVIRIMDQLDTDHINLGRPEITILASTVPVPAAFWLFGSGLLGLIGIARRKHRLS